MWLFLWRLTSPDDIKGLKAWGEPYEDLIRPTDVRPPRPTEGCSDDPPFQATGLPAGLVRTLLADRSEDLIRPGKVALQASVTHIPLNIATPLAPDTGCQAGDRLTSLVKQVPGVGLTVDDALMSDDLTEEPVRLVAANVVAWRRCGVGGQELRPGTKFFKGGRRCT
ncbi:hypothetical protein ABZ479_20595 [Streptomyces sp. NPDC005722]